MRFLRSLVFLMGALLIIFIGVLPGDFSKGAFSIHYVLFAWVAAFTMRRPNSVFAVSVIIVAVFYAAYVDEGIALGAFALVGFSIIARLVRDELVKTSFFLEWGGMTALFFVTEFIRDLLLRTFFTYSWSMLELIKYSLYFALVYPVFAVSIYVVMRSRSRRLEEE